MKFGGQVREPRPTQLLVSLFDGITRYTPEGLWFEERIEEVGFQQAGAGRNSGGSDRSRGEPASARPRELDLQSFAQPFRLPRPGFGLVAFKMEEKK